MIDFANDAIGTKYGCNYSYLSGAIGNFGKVLEGANDGRAVFDPVAIPASLFTTKDDPPFKPIIRVGNGFTFNTSYKYPQTSEVLESGTMESTQDEVDFDKFKKVLNFTSLDTFTITAIPHDQLYVTTKMIGVEDYARGIESITLTKTNITVHVALSKDNENWVTWDTANSAWVPVTLGYTYDETNTTDSELAQRKSAYDAMKSAMCLDTDINSLSAGDYSSYFDNIDKIGIALLLSIEPTDVDTDTYDTSLVYALTGINIDFVSDSNPDSTTVPVKQYFNFVKVGYTPEGNVLLYADRVIQQSISYATLSAPIATTDYIFGNTRSPLSTDRYPMYMRLPQTNISGSNGEWDDIVVNAPSSLTGSLTPEEYFTTNIASMTATISGANDSDGTVFANTSIVYRGGLSDISRYINVAYNTAGVNYGWRPVVEVDITSRAATKSNPVAALPVVTSISKLTKGKCISCDYIFNSTMYDTFKNLGKAKYGLLSDYTNRKTGSFYFICVGYTRDGGKICVADRPVLTGTNLNTLITNTSPMITGIDGKDVTIDKNTYKVRIMKANASVHPDNTNSEWYAFINNSYDTTKTVNDIWHTDKTVSLTSTLASDSTNTVLSIVKGINDATSSNTKQKAISYNSASNLEAVAFRPVLIIPKATFVQNLVVTPKAGYAVQAAASNYIINADVINKNDQSVEFAIGTSDGKTALTDYSFGEHTVNVSDSNIVDDTNTLSIIVKENNEVKVVTTFDVIKEKSYRLKSTKSYGDIYDGWDSDSVEYMQTNPAPKTNVNKGIVVSGSASYVKLTPFTNKITVK